MKTKNPQISKNKKDFSRRDFINKVGVATVAFAIVPRHVTAGSGYIQPSDLVNVAGIGVGARGAQNLSSIYSPEIAILRPIRSNTGQSLSPDQAAARAKQQVVQQTSTSANQPSIKKLANIYALCDVDSEFAGYVFKRYPKAKTYNDWREMLEKETSIDAVVISTPDHTHASIAAAFIREKKHVYVEKPLCKTIYECRTLARLAKEYDVVTQMGNQGHATAGTRQTVEWVQSGVIGDVREVNVTASVPKGKWPQGDLKRPEGVKVPKTLNYDVWLGPAPVKPYHPDILHFNWRGLRDYGTGGMGDIGAHLLDAVVWALNLGYPTKIQATSTPYNEDYYPAGEIVAYQFPGRYTAGIGYIPPVTVTWSDGGLKPFRPNELESGRSIDGCAVYMGDQGIMMHRSHGAVPELVPSDSDFKGPEPWLPRTADIYEDWINAIKSGKKSCNDFSISAKLTEIMLLTNIAVLMQDSNTILEYDAANMKITNLPEANNLFHYEYRTGWTL